MKRIVVLGSGFAGMWAALAARQRVAAAGVPDDAVDIAVVAPRPSLVLKPRLYEREPSAMQVDLAPLFAVTGIRFVHGMVSRISWADRRVAFSHLGRRGAMTYDRLVLATGSRGEVPPIPGLVEFAYSIENVARASLLEFDFDLLLARAAGTVAETVVIIGAGFTGIEIASELASRVKEHGLAEEAVRIVILDQGPVLAPSLGEEARRVVAAGLCDVGIQWILSATVKDIDFTGVRLSTGQFVPASMVIWAGGVRANALTRQLTEIPDSSGRVLVNDDLRSPAHPDIFVAGDTACARVDDTGNTTTMSCQHAIASGRYAGANAAADVLGLQTSVFRHSLYATCLDLGLAGALFTEGYDHAVRLTKAEAKAVKRMLNSQAIYPPPPIRAAALDAAAVQRWTDAA